MKNQNSFFFFKTNHCNSNESVDNGLALNFEFTEITNANNSRIPNELVAADGFFIGPEMKFVIREYIKLPRHFRFIDLRVESEHFQ